jgi:hypothetical protein
MCDEEDLRIQSKMFQSVTTTVPIVLLQRAEERFPALREGTVSDV